MAGLTATDDRFYCPFQTWTIGDETIKFAADCMAHEPGSPVSHFFFMPQQIRGDQELPVQAALNGILSNTVLVSEGTVTQETAVYRAVLEHLTNRLLILHGETGPGTEDTADQLATAVDPDLLQAYLAANENSISLRYLFEKSRIYFVTPGAAVRRDYLPTRASAQACAVFHSEYPGLGGGIVTLSRIGYHEEGALVHVLQECGTNTDHQAIYYTLVRDDGVWQVTDTLKVSDDLAILESQLDYLTRSSGCGDIFVYRSNASKSEFAIVSIDARSLDLSGEPVTLDLATNPDQVGVWIDVYAENVEKFGTIPYCSDIGRTNYPQSVWQAISGTVTVTVSANPPIEPCTGEAYQADVLIEDMIFALDAEMRHLPSLEFKDVTVGWCPG